MSPKRVLIPIDFSPASLAALTHASKIIDVKQTEFVLLFVVEPAVYATAGDLYGMADLGRVLEDQQRSGRTQLERVRKAWQARLPRLRAVLMTGPPASMIVSAATKLKADLIVMATHGRTGLSHLFLGSVAERVVRTARCPVLTVRPKASTAAATARARTRRAKRRSRRATA